MRNIGERVAKLEARYGRRTGGVLTYDPWNGQTAEDALARAPSAGVYLIVPVAPEIETWERLAREQALQLDGYSKPPSRPSTSPTC